MPDLTTDVAVIGGGPAGYSAALRYSKLGARVALIEQSELGGACLNRACIPTKTLLHSLRLMRSINNSGRFGVSSGPATIDIDKLRERKNAVISMMTSGVEQAMIKSGITIIQGKARLLSPGEIEITGDNDNLQTLTTHKIIIATGSVPCRLNTPGADDPTIMYSSDILDIKRIPQSIIMIGGGAVGVELAVILNGLGTRVIILEIMPRILSSEDSEVTQILEASLKKDGLKIYTSAQIDHIETLQGVKRVHFMCGDIENTLDAEAVCIAIGQRPFFDGLGLDECGVKTSPRGIEVNAHMRTTVPGIFAAGDVAGKYMLAYVAMAEGRIAAENALGGDAAMDYSAIPHCVYSSLELASVGLTESEALSRGLKIRCLRANMAANASATIMGERRGMVKIVADAESGKVLGVHIAGIGASNLIAECALAIKLNATVTDLTQTLHPHPSLSEAVWQASLNTDS